MEKLTPEAGGAEEKRKLYVFLNHNFGDPCAHALYVLQIPNPSDPGEVEEEKSILSPNLSFPQRHYGRDMCCVSLDSKLYFIGGASRDLITGDPIYHTDVFILDTAAGVPPPGTPPERNSEFLTVGRNMNTGKIGTVVAFVADGNIFVLSGRRTPGFHSFEMFTPDSYGGGKWDILAPPPFKHNLHSHVTGNGKLFVSCNNDVSLYIFDLSSKQWDKVDQSPIFLGAASLILDNNKLYCCSNRFSPLVMCQALEFSAHNKGVPPCVGDNVTYKSRYTLQSWSPSAYLTYIGNGHLCFLQVGCARDPLNEDEFGCYDPEKCYMHISLFDSSTNDVYPIAAAHFTVNPFGAITKVAAAMAV